MATLHPPQQLELLNATELHERATTAEYRRHIHSLEWQLLRIVMLIVHGSRCQRCGRHLTHKTGQLHHKHYRTVGHESLDDVEILCGRCHMRVHGRTPKCTAHLAARAQCGCNGHQLAQYP
jgi:5-methylcytosine-specific restriction endonuclease McrA